MFWYDGMFELLMREMLIEGWQVEWYCLTNDFWTGKYWDDFSVDGFNNIDDIDDGGNECDMAFRIDFINFLLPSSIRCKLSL